MSYMSDKAVDDMNKKGVGIRSGFYVSILDFEEAQVRIMKLPKGMENIEDIEKWLFEDLGYKDSQIEWMTSKELSVKLETPVEIKGWLDFYWVVALAMAVKKDNR